jgi:hypothetical protein
MYFALSNVFGYFSSVTNIITFIGTLGIFLICLRRPAGKTIAVLALTALVIASFSPLGNMLLTPLEQRVSGMRLPPFSLAVEILF